MLKFLALTFAIVAVALPAAAQRPTNGPTPREQVGMHIGDANTNGSATIVNDRNGIHPDGFTGQLPRNRIAASSRSTHSHRHHHRHHRVL
jgi:hypothetical protein